jgi:hypothetical protein
MDDDSPLPGIEVLSVNSIDEVVSRIPRRHKYFTLLLAWDAPDIPRSDLIRLVRPLVNNCLAYFCAWGEGCEEVHDAVDLADLEREREFGESDYFQMTTWHKNEPLDDAVWFFKHCAIPAEEHVLADWERFAVSVGNPAWKDRIVDSLSRVEVEEEEGE